MKNHGELSSLEIKTALKNARINGQHAKAIRRALGDRLQPGSLGLTEASDVANQSALRMVNGRKIARPDKGLLTVRLPLEGFDPTDEDVSRFTDEELVLTHALRDALSSDPANLDHRIAEEVDPDTLSYPDPSRDSDIMERERALVELMRITMRWLDREAAAYNAEETPVDFPVNTFQGAPQIERRGTPRHRRPRIES